MSIEHRANFMDLIWKERIHQDTKFPPEEDVNISDYQMFKFNVTSRINELLDHDNIKFEYEKLFNKLLIE